MKTYSQTNVGIWAEECPQVFTQHERDSSKVTLRWPWLNIVCFSLRSTIKSDTYTDKLVLFILSPIQWWQYDLPTRLYSCILCQCLWDLFVVINYNAEFRSYIHTFIHELLGVLWTKRCILTPILAFVVTIEYDSLIFSSLTHLIIWQSL